ncbi:MAG: hypothetical protein WCF16_09745, partial [Alphaproteobacteria bacterium]
MTRSWIWTVAALLLVLGASSAFAADAPAQGDDWAARFKAQCQTRGISAEECETRLKEREVIREQRMDAERERCRKEGITDEAKCREWISQQRDQRREQAKKRFDERCKQQGLSPEQCRKQAVERRKQLHDEYAKFRQECRDKGVSDDACRKEFREKHRMGRPGMRGKTDDGSGKAGKGDDMGDDKDDGE